METLKKKAVFHCLNNIFIRKRKREKGEIQCRKRKAKISLKNKRFAI